jgi:hypothetical protein
VRLKTISGGHVPQISCILDEDVLGTRCIPRDHITQIEVEIPSAQIHFLLREHIDGHLLSIFVDSLRPLLSIKNLKVVHIVLYMLSEACMPLYSRAEECLTSVIQGVHAMGAQVLWYDKRHNLREYRGTKTQIWDYNKTFNEMMRGSATRDGRTSLAEP